MGFISNIIKKFRKKKDSNKANYLKSSNTLTQKLKYILTNYRAVDEELLNEIEEALIISDASVEVSATIVEELRKRMKTKNLKTTESVVDELMQVIHDFYERGDSKFKLNVKNNELNVILVAGTNGSGKTTSIAKLAYYFRERGFKVITIAGDTFRAGAVKQIEIWSERLNVRCVIPEKQNQDPASVIYKGIEKAIQEKCTMVICDTAGRSQTKKNLMNELTRIKNVIVKLTNKEPCEVLLTIDSTSGQNGISQAKHFLEAINVTGIILTKLDGLSKGAIILPIMDKFNIPVRFIGFGETYYDISEFSIDSYLYNLVRPLTEGKDAIWGFGYG